MTLKEKIDKICSDNGIKEQKELAEILNFPYQLFNRNINQGKLSGDMIKAFVNNNKIIVDYIWLIRDSEIEMNEDPVEKLNKAIFLLNELKEELTRK